LDLVSTDARCWHWQHHQDFIAALIKCGADTQATVRVKKREGRHRIRSVAYYLRRAIADNPSNESISGPSSLPCRLIRWIFLATKFVRRWYLRVHRTKSINHRGNIDSNPDFGITNLYNVFVHYPEGKEAFIQERLSEPIACTKAIGYFHASNCHGDGSGLINRLKQMALATL
jgi:hypothetical protein